MSAQLAFRLLKLNALQLHRFKPSVAWMDKAGGHHNCRQDLQHLHVQVSLEMGVLTKAQLLHVGTA